MDKKLHKNDKARDRAAPSQPAPVTGAKSGVAPGEASDAASRPHGGDKPVAEEDVFGGAERVKDQNVKSPETKP
jgi:hypothetical protein